MKRVYSLLAALILCISLSVPLLVGSGCKSPSQQKVAVNTLFTIHKTVDALLGGYLDLVIKGTVATNAVPKVMAAYGTFQAEYNSAVTVVVGNTNAVAPQSLVDAAASFTRTLTTAKAGGL